MPAELRGIRGSLLASLDLCSYKNQGHTFLLGEFDGELITWLKVKHCCVGLADQQVSVALNDSFVGQLASTLANTSGSTATKLNTLGKDSVNKGSKPIEWALGEQEKKKKGKDNFFSGACRIP